MSTHHFIKISFLFFFLALIPNELSAQQQTWTTKSSDGFAARQGHASCVIEDKIYVIGGASAVQPYINSHNYIQIYDPSTDSWSTPQTTGIFSIRYGATASVVNRKIYVIGGYSNLSPSLPTKVDVFDPSINNWSSPVTTGTFTPRELHVASVVDDKIYIIGGTQFPGLPPDSGTDLQVFDPSTNIWSTPVITGLSYYRQSATSTVVDGKIYYVGGDTVSKSWVNGRVDRLDVFDPSTNTWSTRITTGFFLPLRNCASETLDGKIYIFGGDEINRYPELEIFDPIANEWSTPKTTGIFTPRYELTASAVNGKIYVLGGINFSSNSALNTNEEFTPVFDDVKSEKLLQDIELFPNPTSGVIRVHSSGMNILHISVVNILGQNVIDLTNSEGGEIKLDLSKYERGIYYAKVVTKNSVILKRIILF